jgi:8-oxo-dGTP pyrophosphatase MutT (NUDIX family)
VRFLTVVERLSQLPDRLPHGSRAIDPVLLGPSLARPDWTRSEPSVRRAAGLVLLFPDDAGTARIVLTERPDGMRHAGQVSLPGGKEDPGDEFPVGTALREAQEEVGLDVEQAGVRVVGLLDVVDVRVSGFMLTPVVTLADRAPVLVASPREVASVLVPPLDIFLPDAPIRVVEEDRDGYRIRYGGYPWDGHLIWGATARVLAQLGAILGGADAPSDGSP